MSIIIRLFEYVTGSSPNGHLTITTKEAIRVAERARELSDELDKSGNADAADDLDQIADAVMALIGDRIWQPIATADEFEDILVRGPGFKPCVATWMNYSHRKPGWYIPTYGNHEAQGPIYPTHWRPLPQD